MGHLKWCLCLCLYIYICMCVCVYGCIYIYIYTSCAGYHSSEFWFLIFPLESFFRLYFSWNLKIPSAVDSHCKVYFVKDYCVFFFQTVFWRVLGFGLWSCSSHHQKAVLYLLIPSSFKSTEFSLIPPADLILLLCCQLWKLRKYCTI